MRVGDASVAPVYANEGRLRAGSLEQMEYFATRDYVADRLAGFSGLLIVGSNQRAQRLSRDIQSQLTELGLVGTQKLAQLRDHNELRMGDRIQARQRQRVAAGRRAARRARAPAGPGDAGGQPAGVHRGRVRPQHRHGLRAATTTAASPT